MHAVIELAVCAGLIVIENSLSAFSAAHTDLDHPRKPHLVVHKRICQLFNSMSLPHTSPLLFQAAITRRPQCATKTHPHFEVAYAGADGYSDRDSIEAMLIKNTE